MIADLRGRREAGVSRGSVEDEERPVISDNSSDGDDEESDDDSSHVVSSRASLDEANESTDERPLLGTSLPDRTALRRALEPGSLVPGPRASFSSQHSPHHSPSPYLPSTPLLHANHTTMSTSPTRPPLRRPPGRDPPRTIYTLALHTLQPLYPIIWRLTSLLSHVGYGLLYAWFPTLLLTVRNTLRVQWWSVILLLMVMSIKGASTVLWFGGTVARWGVGWITAVGLGAAVVTWLAGLGVWGIIDIPWDWGD